MKKRAKKRRRGRARGSIATRIHMSKNLGAWIRRENKLGGPGYTSRPERTRHMLLRRSLEHFGYRSTLGSLLVLLRNSSMGDKARRTIELDVAWLKEHA